ncbi:hypothetical protein [Planktothrix agardhii]|uniref:Uncharacterized protein n=1 Tax=Planktothrix agardhii (strain NIVA-CYA 126/8) TaxID=388467 RepID=A0A073CGJ1_PLAA1|nr:hypothetical protein [Planktothrix agardhii]KEI67027.1 hypothetical protein A19Y_2059 [Planktothrix agardhii NIVA-CYA 126/8]MCB8786425.1 hypothetical protein [Planktothrix agardhii 1025]MCF3578521.1 hypothetical protein [Planktothrix agardhii 1812]MCF3611932.1 hypothetical protein [Planktothrix agardhii 1027]MCF3645707.1 hypothetical protein [Planktothrix agardhii 1026]
MSSTPSIDSSNAVASTNEVTNKTRFLLTLWAMSCSNSEVKKSELNSKLKQKRQGTNFGVSQSLYEELQAADAIKIYKRNQTVMVSLTDTGKQMLIAALTNSDFAFDTTIIASRLGNGLIKLIRELNQGGIPTTSVKQPVIASYEEFKAIALQVYDQLNKDYNLNDLVPIYRIRRTIGDQVTRSQFNEWILEMQANDILQLMAGEMPDLTPDKREDSITLPSGGFRYYIQRLDSDN